ncbi:hypothetical protein JW898_06105 [Candidatus Woesearchaeota archaeon]|nr:hypothetical protein [Candidatus Woesearchaeota archaeon]
MWKRFSVLFVMAVFLLSMVPMAFAEDAERVRAQEGVQAEEDTTPVIVSAQESEPLRIRQEVREIVREGGENDTPRVEVRQEIRAAVRERIRDMPLLAKRVMTEEMLNLAKERYQKAKDNFLRVRENYIDQKEKFNRAREQYKDCQDSESDDCQQKREQIRKQAQPHLLNAADLVLKEIERVKANVEASEDLSEEEIAEIAADLDAKTAEVEAAKAVIENLDESSSNEEINEAARTIREAWQSSKVALKKHAGRIVNARLGNIVLKTEQLEKRLYNAKDKLSERGADVSVLDAKLSEFSAKLDTAADKYNQARRIWSAANTPGEVDEAAKEVHALLAEAKTALKDARDLLRDVVNEIKRLNDGSVDVAEEETEDSENSQETEAEDE